MKIDLEHSRGISRGTMLIAVLLTSLLAGCFDSGGSSRKKEDPIEPTTSIEGVVAKGPVGGATVEVYAVNDSGERTGDPIATVTTNDDGEYTLSLGTYSGVYVLVAHGGSYVDEATGQTETIPEASPLRAVSSVAAPSADTTVTASVTPLTEIATRVASQRSGGLTETNVTGSNDDVAALFFGTSDSPGQKMLTTRPSDVIDDSSSDDDDDQRLYGLMLGTISVLNEETDDLEETLASLSDDIATNNGLQQSSTALVAASTRFVTSVRNNSGITTASSVINILAAAASGVGTAVALSDDANITRFTFADTLSSEIDKEAHTIAVVQPTGTDLAALSDPTIRTSLGSTIAADGDVDFSGAVTYVVTAQDDATTQEWVVTVTVAASAASPLARMTGAVSDLIDEAVVNRTARRAVGSVATLADLVALDEVTDPADIFDFSDGATATRLSGTFVGGDVVYQVTAEDGSTIREWQVLLVATEPEAQPALAFASGDLSVEVTSAPVQLSVSGGLAQAATTFQSSDTGVATVDGSGLVTIQGPGSANITARKAAVTTATVAYLATEASVALTVGLAEQSPLSFAESSVSVTLGGVATNALRGGDGTGDVTYSSSDEGVATVASDGALTLVAAGSATISAVKAADDTYLESNEASYALTVTAAPTSEPVICVLDQSNWDECELD